MDFFLAIRNLGGSEKLICRAEASASMGVSSTGLLDDLIGIETLG